MKKKILSLIMVLVLSLSMACTSVFACDFRPVNHNLVTAKLVVAATNETIDTLVKVAKLTPYDDVDLLLITVDALAASTTRTVNALGYQVECVYEKHVIDNRVVYIDPLRVITPLDD